MSGGVLCLLGVLAVARAYPELDRYERGATLESEAA